LSGRKYPLDENMVNISSRLVQRILGETPREKLLERLGEVALINGGLLKMVGIDHDPVEPVHSTASLPKSIKNLPVLLMSPTVLS
jgi:hypothetical protein